MDLRNFFARKSGILVEGTAGFIGLAGVNDVAGQVAPLLNIPSMNIETIQSVVGILMNVLLGLVTVYRLIKPKKVIVTDQLPPGITNTPITGTPPPVPPFNPTFNQEENPRY